MNVSETNKFTSNVSGETYKINHKLNRDDNYLIYLSAVKNNWGNNIYVLYHLVVTIQTNSFKVAF